MTITPLTEPYLITTTPGIEPYLNNTGSIPDPVSESEIAIVTYTWFIDYDTASWIKPYLITTPPGIEPYVITATAGIEPYLIIKGSIPGAVSESVK